MSLLDSSEGDNSQHELTLLELNNYPNPQMICKLEITTPLGILFTRKSLISLFSHNCL